MKRKNSRSRRPEILVSNDDGIDAPGLHALVGQLKRLGNVTVVAPEKQQSAVGHAITMNFPLRVREYEKNGSLFGYAVAGTPADAVKLGVRALLKRKPDVLISGINHGSNTAISIIYSGTVSAATEGTILGIPSLAVSLTTYRKADFRFAAKIARKLTRFVLQRGLPPGTLLNVNVPAIPERQIQGVLLTRQSKATWNDTFEPRRDPANKEYYWLTGVLKEAELEKDSDQWAVKNKYVSVTPIHYDLTDYPMLNSMMSWDLDSLS